MINEWVVMIMFEQLIFDWFCFHELKVHCKNVLKALSWDEEEDFIY